MLPRVPYQQKRQEPQITAFRGINYRPEPVDGELAEARYISTERYPFMSPFKGRKVEQRMNDPKAVWAGDHLVLVDGTDLLLDGDMIGSVEDGPKQFAAINSKLVIWPDRKYIDFNTGALKGIEASFTSENGATVTQNSLTLADSVVLQWHTTIENYYLSGNPDQDVNMYITVYSSLSGLWDGSKWVVPVGGTLPAGGTEYDAHTLYGMETADLQSALVGKYVMARYNMQEEMNKKTVRTYYPRSERQYTVTTNYAAPAPNGNCFRITAVYKPDVHGKEVITIVYDLVSAASLPMLNRLFSEGDAVKVTGEGIDTENVIIREISDNTLIFDDGTFDVEGTVATPVTVERRAPDLDYICASENRLWGVSNREEGEVYDRETGKMVTVYNRVIHASALGDPLNFYVFDGLSTDSYAVAVAEAGDFTACTGYRGDALFFKERKLFRIAGDYPAEYAMYVYDVPGVENGSWNSLAIINDVLYYLSPDGVQAWAGSENTLISYNLFDRLGHNGVAGTDGTYYWLCTRKEVPPPEGETGPAYAFDIFVYDTLHNIWTREDNTEVRGYCLWQGSMYMLNLNGLARMNVPAEEGATEVRWSAELAPADETRHTQKGVTATMERKNYRWIRLRVDLPAGSTFNVYTAFDNETEWTLRTSMPSALPDGVQIADGLFTINIPLPPNRVDRIRIRLSGRGDFTLRDVVRAYNIGSLSTR